MRVPLAIGTLITALRTSVAAAVFTISTEVEVGEPAELAQFSTEHGVNILAQCLECGWRAEAVAEMFGDRKDNVTDEEKREYFQELPAKASKVRGRILPATCRAPLPAAIDCLVDLVMVGAFPEEAIRAASRRVAELGLGVGSPEEGFAR